MSGQSSGDVYRADPPSHGGYGMPRGPIPTIPESVPTVAIGFCPMCGENARGTCANRGMFDCPRCTFWWFDERVGSQTRSFEDDFSPAEGGNDCSKEGCDREDLRG